MLYSVILSLLICFYFLSHLIQFQSFFFAKINLYLVLAKLNKIALLLTLALFFLYPFTASSEVDPVVVALLEEIEKNLPVLDVYRTSYKTYPFVEMPNLITDNFKNYLDEFAKTNCIMETFGTSSKTESIALKIQLLCMNEFSVKHNHHFYGSKFSFSDQNWKTLLEDKDKMVQFVHFSSFFGINYVLESHEHNVKSLCLFPEIPHDSLGSHFGYSIKHVPLLECLIQHLPSEVKIGAETYIKELTQVSEKFKIGHRFYCGTSEGSMDLNRTYHHFNDFSATERKYFLKRTQETIPSHTLNPPVEISTALRESDFPFFHHLWKTKTLTEEHYDGFAQSAEPEVPATSSTDWTKVFSSGPL